MILRMRIRATILFFAAALALAALPARAAVTLRGLLLDENPRAAWFERYNPAYVGGDIAGGAHSGLQVVFRPVPQLRPYHTPNPRLFLCSASTPPGGGVHGMSGYHAAQAVLAARLRSPRARSGR